MLKGLTAHYLLFRTYPVQARRHDPGVCRCWRCWLDPVPVGQAARRHDHRLCRFRRKSTSSPVTTVVTTPSCIATRTSPSSGARDSPMAAACSGGLRFDRPGDVRVRRWIRCVRSACWQPMATPAVRSNLSARTSWRPRARFTSRVLHLATHISTPALLTGRRGPAVRCGEQWPGQDQRQPGFCAVLTARRPIDNSKPAKQPGQRS